MDRRDFLKTITHSTAVLTVAGVVGWRLSFAGEPADDDKLIVRDFYTMGTVGKIKIATDNKKQGIAALDAACTRIDYLNNKLTKFTSYSDIGQLNSQPKKAIYVCQDTINVLKIGLALTPLTRHRFDMGMGNVLTRFGVDTEVPMVGKQPITEQMVRNDKLVEINGQMVRLMRPDTMLDLGAIAKGYAADEAMKVLLSHGIKHAAVDLGGDIIVYGGKAPGKPWVLGMDSKANVVHTQRKFKLISSAIASSGDYIQHNHIIDPLNLRPSTSYALTTVIGPKGIVCDALATAAYNTPMKEMHILQENFPDYQFINSYSA